MQDKSKSDRQNVEEKLLRKKNGKVQSLISMTQQEMKKNGNVFRPCFFDLFKIIVIFTVDN